MPSLNKALDDAVDASILNRDQRASLGLFLAQRGLIETEETEQDSDTVTDSEAPRFLRGFHDILITIGILAAVIGVWTMSNALVVIVATWILAEIFVKRQRLALPAFTLTLTFVAAVCSAYGEFVVPYLSYSGLTGGASSVARVGDDIFSVVSIFVFGFLFLLITLIPLYWRFRVPVSLACLILGIGGSVFTALFWALISIIGDADFIEHYPALTMAMALAYALSMFGIALRFDLSDRDRITRRSDVAFWLHLCAAPMMLFSTVLLVLALTFGIAELESFSNYPNIVIPVVIVLMLIGIVIDRRAFVTAGLISLGTAIAALVSEYGGDIEDYLGLTILLVGLVVLTLGSNWQRIRRLVVGRLPDTLQERLPPLT